VADQNGRIHNQVAELLSAYIDDEVSADERALVEAHLTTCTTCAQDLTALRQTVALLGVLPQMAAPRPFTLRESDVRPVPSPARPAWWQLPWVRGLAAATAMMLCVVVVGVVLLGQGGMVGAPAVSERLAMEVPATTEVTSQEISVEKVVEEAETVREVEKEGQDAVEPAALPPAPQEATAEFEMMQEAPAEAAPAEEKAVADEGEQLMAAEADRAAAGAAGMPTATPAPMPIATPAPMPTTTPAPAAEAMPAVVAPTLTPTLLEVEDLSLEVEPGVIRASGRVPLPEGRKLRVALWRDGQPVQWETAESRQLVIEADGQFSLVLMAQTGIPSFDLLAAEPAYYEIRIRPVDPPAPVEIRIYFDTYGPPPPVPTSTP